MTDGETSEAFAAGALAKIPIATEAASAEVNSGFRRYEMRIKSLASLRKVGGAWRNALHLATKLPFSHHSHPRWV